MVFAILSVICFFHKLYSHQHINTKRAYLSQKVKRRCHKPTIGLHWPKTKLRLFLKRIDAIKRRKTKLNRISNFINRQNLQNNCQETQDNSLENRNIVKVGKITLGRQQFLCGQKSRPAFWLVTSIALYSRDHYREILSFKRSWPHIPEQI